MFLPNFCVATPRFSTTVLFANEASRAAARNIGLFVAGVVLAFAIWQFREQYDRVKRAETRFSGRSEREFKFLKRQAFRRLQLSGLAGIAGALMLVGLYLPPDWSPIVWTSAWLGAVFFVGWAALLAGVDAVSIWLHFASAGRRQSVEKILLEYKLRQLNKKKNDSKNEPSENDEFFVNDADESSPEANEQNQPRKTGK